MIIIDEGAVGKLIETVKTLRHAEGRHCLRLYPIDGNAQHIRDTLIALAQAYLPDSNLYACEDGENYLLTQPLSVKECKKALLAIAEAFTIQPAEYAGEIYDLALQGAKLLALLEKKIAHSRETEDAAARQLAQRQAAALAARKRQKILNKGAGKSAAEIAAQRDLRSEPVLMIIEDDPFSRRLVKNVLDKKYDLTELASAEEALSTYVDIAPDLLFLDINLPDVTGHELLAKIIGLDPRAYIIMLSGNADRSNIVQAMEQGAKGFVAKPFSRDKLFQYIERCPTISREKAI